MSGLLCKPRMFVLQQQVMVQLSPAQQPTGMSGS
jgi:hypothetical protein